MVRCTCIVCRTIERYLTSTIQVLTIEIPGRGNYDLRHLVLDVNGTIACDGEVIAGVTSRLTELTRQVEVHLITADTRGRQAAIDAQLRLQAVRISPKNERFQKAAFVERLGSSYVCAIGNGANDADMLRVARLSIAVIGGEGLAVETLSTADVVVSHINAALDLLLFPMRLVATLRR